MPTAASTLVFPITLTESTSTPTPSAGASSSKAREEEGLGVRGVVESGVAVGAIWVAGVVEAGSNVGVAGELVLVFSPPHAAKSNTKVRMTPVTDNLGKCRAAGVRFKAESP